MSILPSAAALSCFFSLDSTCVVPHGNLWMGLWYLWWMTVTTIVLHIMNRYTTHPGMVEGLGDRLGRMTQTIVMGLVVSFLMFLLAIVTKHAWPLIPWLVGIGLWVWGLDTTMDWVQFPEHRPRMLQPKTVASLPIPIDPLYQQALQEVDTLLREGSDPRERPS